MNTKIKISNALVFGVIGVTLILIRVLFIANYLQFVFDVVAGSFLTIAVAKAKFFLS
ncbi:MAG: hypothetical protein J0L86_07570 [Flavobacteriales bacterium]|nr:hypothetical protein [Flavobacteriales bacterium]